jgi:hypothetical protein
LNGITCVGRCRPCCSPPSKIRSRGPLSPLGCLHPRSVYLALSQEAAVTCFKEVWKTRVPLKIKIIMWQLIRGRLPLGEQISKRHSPSNGLCSLCLETEDCNHIFLSCPMVRLMWSGARELLHCDWNPAGVGDFLPLSHGLFGPFHRLVLFTFAAQC